MAFLVYERKLEKLAFDLGYRVINCGKDIVGVSNKIIKGWVNSSGYRIFRIGHNTGSVSVHRMVAYQQFGEKIYEPGIVVRHLDGNSMNNSPENLALGTPSDNSLDIPQEVRNRSGRIAGRSNSKLTDQDVLDIRELSHKGMLGKEIAEKFSILKSTVSDIINRKLYKYI